MNASVILNLYPKSWRARYEAEFRAMLEEHPVSAMEALDIMLGAVDAHVRPQEHARSAGEATSAEPTPDPRRAATRRATIETIFFAHLAVFAALSTLLVLINVFFTPDNWWSLYPLWAWGSIFAVHAGLVFQWRGLLGAHLALYTLVNLGLATINLVQGGQIWFIWPMIGLGIVLIAHVLIALRKVSLIRAHVAATAVGIVGLIVLFLAAGFDGFVNIFFGICQLGVVLAAHWLMRFRGWNLFRAHTLVYAGVLSLMLVNNLIDDPGELWVQYPFAMWTVVLIGHALVHYRIPKWTGSDWEALMLEELGTRGQTDRQRRLLGTLGMHVYLFLVGTVGFVLINVMAGIGSFWAVWPIGVWYVLLAFHAGYVFAPRRILGSLLVGWFATSAGLIAIDVFATDNTWWYWPVMWSGVVIATVVGALWTRGRPWVGGHVLGGVALAIALVMTDLVTGPPAWWFYPVAVLIVSWLVHFGLSLDLDKVMKVASND